MSQMLLLHDSRLIDAAARTPDFSDLDPYSRELPDRGLGAIRGVLIGAALGAACWACLIGLYLFLI